MLSVGELLILQQLAKFAKKNKMNQTQLARDTGLSRQKIVESLKKFEELEINVKK